MRFFKYFFYYNCKEDVCLKQFYSRVPSQKIIKISLNLIEIATAKAVCTCALYKHITSYLLRKLCFIFALGTSIGNSWNQNPKKF